MEGFTYVDLFETKGIEYLLVIGFLIALILFWRFINTPAGAAAKVRAVEPDFLPSGPMWFHLADNLHYHPGHSWAMPDSTTQVVKVGIDDFAQKLLGKLEHIEMPKVGSKVTQGEEGWRIQVDSKVFSILSPVSGEIVEINSNLLQTPEAVARDPYQNGWLAKIKAPRLKVNLKNLLSGEFAKAWIKETENKLRATMAGELGMVLQDGGELIPGIGKSLAPEKWDEVVRSFLLT